MQLWNSPPPTPDPRVATPAWPPCWSPCPCWSWTARTGPARPHSSWPVQKVTLSFELQINPTKPRQGQDGEDPAARSLQGGGHQQEVTWPGCWQSDIRVQVPSGLQSSRGCCHGRLQVLCQGLAPVVSEKRITFSSRPWCRIRTWTLRGRGRV